ncbi:MAG: phage tail sheath family protein [Bacillota bacterium]
MPEYLSPGVYVEEIEIGSKPIEGVSTSTAGFLGETERGPTTLRLITSWLQFQRVYGGYLSNGKYLPHAVEGFFANGGQRCYIARVVDQEANAAGEKLTRGADNALTVTAVGEGAWGNNVQVKVATGTLSGFRLTVKYGATEELFDNLSVNSTSSDYFEKRVNGVSNFVVVSKAAGDSGETPDGPADFTNLAGGDDGTTPLDLADFTRTDIDTPGQRKGLTAFKEIDEISIVYAPNAATIAGLVSALVTHCENLKDRFAIIDAEQGQSNISALNPRSSYDTKYAAFYYPWLKVYDPLSKSYKLVPPGGHVAGIYARSDTERGVHKAPANEVVRGAVDLEFAITKGEQDILNLRGVNCIRAFPGRGIRVWGARTLSSDPLWKYVNVRRLFLFLEESIDEGTQWVVFEPNDEKLWARVRQSITEFLTRVWKDGALMGTTPEEAFFVKCDRTTMTQDDIDNGRLICIIGVAPVKPAEFVIFRIAQWQGGSEVNE